MLIYIQLISNPSLVAPSTKTPMLHPTSKTLRLSPLFSLDESFTDLTTSSFNTRGEVSSTVSIIKNGVFENALINSKTANEYNLESNYAEDENSWGMGEYFRSPSMHGGSLHDDDKLKALDTGLFMSNIHYLNWSDNLGGRITGLTRYVCYWVKMEK